jgi:autotransporter-associated beta strand protein
MPQWNGSPIGGHWQTSLNWSGEPYPDGIDAFAGFNFSQNIAQPININFSEGSTITLGDLNIAKTSLTEMNILGSGALKSTLIFSANDGRADVITFSSAGNINFLDSVNVQLNSNTYFTVIGGTTVVNSAISGSASLIKEGAGVLTLSGANSFSGGLGVYGGTLRASSAAALATGTITVGNNAMFSAVGSVSNTIATISNAIGSQGGATIDTAAFSTLTLSGTLNHLSQGRLKFFGNGSSIIIASLSAIGQNPVDSSYRIDRVTLRMGNAFSASELLYRPGQSLTEFADSGVLDTGGFTTRISNLNLTDQGTILSSTGALNLTLEYVAGVTGISTQGNIQGTGGADSIVVNIASDLAISNFIWTSWTAGVDTITLNGSNVANFISGSSQHETINGQDGNDDLRGNGGIDTIDGGVGDDLIVIDGAASAGSFINGGSGTDTLLVAGLGSSSLGSLSGIEILTLSSGLALTGAQINSGLAINTDVNGSGALTINMTAGVTLLTKLFDFTGYSGIVTINGTAGADIIKLGNAVHSINTGNGSNIVQGGGLVDTVTGGTGVDKFAGNAGADVLTGGTAADVFKYRAAGDSGMSAGNRDTITDFLIGTDRMNFVKIDANAGLAGDQAFAFVGTGAFIGGGAGSIRYQNSGADLLVLVDVDGNGTAEMSIVLAGRSGQTLTVADFVL